MTQALELATLDDHAISQIVSNWLARRAPKTRDQYRRTLQRFAVFVGVASPAQALLGLLQGGPGRAYLTVESYVAHLREGGLGPSSINQQLAALRGAVLPFQQAGIVGWSLRSENLRGGGTVDVAGPTPEQAGRVLRAAGSHPDPWHAARGVLIVRLCLDLSLRTAEICALDWPDSFPSMDELRVRRKKQAGPSSWMLTSACRVALECWLVFRGPQHGPLLQNARGSRLGDRGLLRIVRGFGERVGIHATPNKLRHTANTLAVEEGTQLGLDLDEITQYTGHKQVQTLLVYRDRARSVQAKIAEAVSRRYDEAVQPPPRNPS